MIDHLVLFSLPPGSAPGALERLASELESFIAQSRHVDSVTLSFDLGLRSRDMGRAQLMAEIRFAREDAFRDYLASEAHGAFVKEVCGSMDITLMSMQFQRQDRAVIVEHTEEGGA